MFLKVKYDYPNTERACFFPEEINRLARLRQVRATGRNRKKWSDALLRSFCRIVRDVSLVYEEIGFGATFLPEYRINQLTWLLQYYNG
jgi:uncharacterized protein YcaQ